MITETIKIPWQKRAFDIGLSIIIMITLSPIYIIILAALFIENFIFGCPGRTLFYVEKRISRGQQFNFVKFNIFTPGLIEKLKSEKIFIHTKDLEHIKGSLTKVGKLIQKVYLDELPQIFSILKGDMSFVGPRPINEKTYARALERGDYNVKIAKTGLTGPYQSHKGENNVKKFKLDSEYVNFIRQNSGWKVFGKDIGIMIRTVLVVLRAKGL